MSVGIREAHDDETMSQRHPDETTDAEGSRPGSDEDQRERADELRH